MDEKTEIALLRVRLIDGAKRVPVRQFQSWDVMRVREFKKQCQVARKVAEKRNASLGELRAAENALALFWS